MTWEDAVTFQDLVTVNIRFVQGELLRSPTYGGPVGSETGEIVEALVILNQRGLLTTGSQPAVSDGHYQQRAWVEGFASEEVAQRLDEKQLCSDIIVRTFGPWDECFCPQIPITQRDGSARTWAGSGAGSSDEKLEIWSVTCRPEAIAALRTSWYVVAIDPSWGRKEYLWRTLCS